MFLISGTKHRRWRSDSTLGKKREPADMESKINFFLSMCWPTTKKKPIAFFFFVYVYLGLLFQFTEHTQIVFFLSQTWDLTLIGFFLVWFRNWFRFCDLYHNFFVWNMILFLCFLDLDLLEMKSLPEMVTEEGLRWYNGYITIWSMR